MNSPAPPVQVGFSVAGENRRMPSPAGVAVSIVVPVYNECDNVAPLLAEIAAAMAQGPSFELICVDDGSRDGSLEALRAAMVSRPWLRTLSLGKNQGQSAAMAAGFRAATADVVVTLDADLQNDPADIPRLLAALGEGPDGYDMVSGIRARRQDSQVRRWASRIANRVRNWAVGDTVRDVGCSLKAYRRSFLLKLPPFNGLHRFLPALLLLQGARITEIPVNHRPRVHGVSKYSINNRLWRGIYDLIGVRWLQRRWVDPSLAEEVSPWISPNSGSS